MPQAPPRRKAWIRPAGPAAAVLAVLWTAGMLVRLTVRDGFVPASTLYYATPIVVLAAVAGLAGLLWRLGGRRTPARIALIAALGCAAWWLASAWHWNRPTGGQGPVRFVLWNVCRGRLGWSGILEQIRGLNPDVIVLNEAGPDGPGQREFLRTAFPGYEVSEVQHGLVVIARGAVEEPDWGLLGPNGRYEHRRVEVRGLAFNILQPEIGSNPLRSRAEALAKLERLAAGLADEPTLIMGDLNTPHDSMHLGWSRAGFASAFQTAGRGHHATWPVPCPVLAIDHVWISRGLRAVSCRLAWTWRSDHLPVVVDVVPAGNPPATSAAAR